MPTSNKWLKNKYIDFLSHFVIFSWIFANYKLMLICFQEAERAQIKDGMTITTDKKKAKRKKKRKRKIDNHNDSEEEKVS